jgi:hypothetical protein
MNDDERALLENQKPAPVAGWTERHPGLTFAALLPAAVGLLWVGDWLTKDPNTCKEYALHAADRRNLTRKERNEVERSCGVSIVYGPIQERERAVELQAELNNRGRCMNPGAYVAKDFNQKDWAVFCPQL